jgi:hypothetical protein
MQNYTDQNGKSYPSMMFYEPLGRKEWDLGEWIAVPDVLS